MTLETELRFYETHRQEYLEKYRNFYVLIKGEELFGPFPDAASAYREGLSRFGLTPFLVKQVLESEPIAVQPIVSMVAVGARL